MAPQDSPSMLFCASLPEPARAEAAALHDLDVILGELLAAARTAWPRLAVDDASFFGHLAGRLADARPLGAALEDIHAADLYLACACAGGSSPALAAFEAHYFSEIDRAARGEQLQAATIDDVKQIVREKLFVRSGHTAPKISEYGGRGELRAWFRVVVVRTLINLATRGPKEQPVADDVFDALPLLTADPGLDHMKATYRAEFRDAFADAAAALTERDRKLLRYAFADGLIIADIAALYGIHRTTAMRWLARARRVFEAKLRRALMTRLQIGQQELESILRLIQSRLDLSIDRVLRAAPES